MRIRAFVVTALLTLPVALSAQVVRTPRRGSTPEPAPLPPTAGPVARAQSQQRSKWSMDGYSILNTYQVPASTGGVSQSTSFGIGTHADYLFAPGMSATIDMGSTFMGGPMNTLMAETGVRYSPLAWNRKVRPFADARVGYTRMFDSFANLGRGGVIGTDQSLVNANWYAAGFGGIAGAGADFAVASSWAISTELLAMRTRMSTYRQDNTANLPIGTNYMMNSFRFTVGLKFAPMRLVQTAQNPRM